MKPLIILLLFISGCIMPDSISLEAGTGRDKYEGMRSYSEWVSVSGTWYLKGSEE